MWLMNYNQINEMVVGQKGAVVAARYAETVAIMLCARAAGCRWLK
jgi:hypothetical protein